MVSQIIFVFTFVLRVCLIAAVADQFWVDFTRDYPDQMQSKLKCTSFSLQFILYNFVPYITLIILHYKNFKPKPEDAPKPVVMVTDDTQFTPHTSANLSANQIPSH